MPKLNKIKKPRVVNKNLGSFAGFATKEENLIEVDKFLSPSERLITLVHEALHIADWNMSERKVTNISELIGEVLWKQGYRKIK
jgi:hypothetical protein